MPLHRRRLFALLPLLPVAAVPAASARPVEVHVFNTSGGTSVMPRLAACGGRRLEIIIEQVRRRLADDVREWRSR